MVKQQLSRVRLGSRGALMGEWGPIGTEGEQVITVSPKGHIAWICYM